MKSDTIAVHGGYETEPTTRAVAVPIYQTVAYEFESADHGAALFNLEVEGHRYSRISNPTTAVLERRIAELEGGVEALCTSTGQAALQLCDPQSRRHGHQHRVGAAALWHDPHAVCAPPAEPGHHGALCRVGYCRRDRKADRRQHARDLLREHRQSGRQHLRH